MERGSYLIMGQGHSAVDKTSEGLSGDEFLTKLKIIDTDADWFAALELLNDFYDTLLEKQQYAQCEDMIKQFLDHDFSVRLHLGLLTITNRRKKYLLQIRPLLYDATQKALLSAGYKKMVIEKLR